MAELVVCVTRPQGQGQALCEQVARLGLVPRPLPLIEIIPHGELSAQQRTVILQLDNYQHLIFISANAIRLGMKVIEDFWPQLPAGLNWYAVGEPSSLALAAYGVTALAPQSQMNSEGLLALPQLRSVNGERILIFKGEGGRTVLRDSLAGRGAQVTQLSLYRRRCPLQLQEQWRRCLSQEQAVILLNSGEALENLLLLAQPGQGVDRPALIVAGARVATLARDAGFTEVYQAENASDVAMLAALNAWQSTRA